MLLGIAFIVVVVGPLLLALAGWMRARSEPSAHMRWDFRLMALSTLLYVLAFNLVFFVQELFLVLPKAFTPGLQPTLFHNNHLWQGEHALASLFQGTGALATVLLGIGCLLLLRGKSLTSMSVRLLLVWLAYCGIFMALPQIVVGALSTGSDVGMAMEYFRLSPEAKSVCALLALAAIPFAARACARQVLRLAPEPALATARARSGFVLQVATIPALLAIVLIVPFRVPREWLEVLFLPLVVVAAGIPWMQAGAWRLRAIEPAVSRPAVSLVYPLVATLALLLVFQLVLRPGVDFF